MVGCLRRRSASAALIRSLVTAAHKGLGVLLTAPGHSTDAHGLGPFDGTALWLKILTRGEGFHQTGTPWDRFAMQPHRGDEF